MRVVVHMYPDQDESGVVSCLAGSYIALRDKASLAILLSVIVEKGGFVPLDEVEGCLKFQSIVRDDSALLDQMADRGLRAPVPRPEDVDPPD